MRFHVFLIVAILGGAGGALADQGTFTPTDIAVQSSGESENVRRDAARASKGFKGVQLEKATVADVDANGDGHISFEELFYFDKKSF